MFESWVSKGLNQELKIRLAETSKYLLNIMMVAYNKVVVNAVSNRRDNSLFIKAVRKIMDKKRSLKNK